MANQHIRKLTQREMTRKEFLTFSLVAVATVFGIVGLIEELSSHAATETTELEPETGTISLPAVIVNDSTASNGKAIEFEAPTTGSQPSGAGIVAYQTLDPNWNNANKLGVTAALNKLTSPAQVSFPAGIFSERDFSHGNYCIYIPVKCTGILGSGIDQTIFQVVPQSSTKAASYGHTAGSDTNPLTVMSTLDPSGGPSGMVFSNFTINGTEQPMDTTENRPHFYNGLRLCGLKNTQVTNVRVCGIPGYSHVNPGETFGINDYECTGTVYTNCEVDGRIGLKADGTTSTWAALSFYKAGDRVGASPMGHNSSTSITHVNGYYHHSLASTFTSWKTNGLTTHNTRSEYNGSGSGILNGHGMNHERCSGEINHYNPTLIIDSAATGNTGLHMSLLSDSGNDTTVYVWNPTWDHQAKVASTVACNGVFTVQGSKSYSNGGDGQEQTSAPNVYASNDTSKPLTPNGASSTADPTKVFLWAYN